MSEQNTIAPPLTRRQARAIERETGRRPIAVSIDAHAAASPAEIRAISEAVTSALATTSGTADAAAGSVTRADASSVTPLVRAGSMRAGRPVALVRQRRRRLGAGFGIAASTAVLATTAVAASGLPIDGDASAASQAALVTADEAAPEISEPAADPGASTAGPSVDLVAAPETAADRGEFSVTSFDPSEVEQVVEEPEVEDAVLGDSGIGDGGVESTGSSDASGIDLAAIAATAASMVGTGGYTHCDAFVREVYAQHGITLGVGVSAQAAQGTATSNPQPGDLVVWPGQHIGIYAGNGMVYDSPGIDDPRPIQHRAISWGSPYFVTLT